MDTQSHTEFEVRDVGPVVFRDKSLSVRGWQSLDQERCLRLDSKIRLQEKEKRSMKLYEIEIPILVERVWCNQKDMKKTPRTNFSEG